MKILFLILVFISTQTFADAGGQSGGGGVSHGKGHGHGHAQRHIDTNPDFKDNNEVNLQLEDNYYSIDGDNTHYANATLGLSLKSGTDIQLATYNCPLYGGGAQNFECDSYINLSQTFKIIESLRGVIGTQNGTVFGSPMFWHSSSYASLNYEYKNVSVRAGPYFINKALSATTNYVGYTTGITYNFTEDLYVEGDYYSGSNNASGANVNIWYKQFYVGVGVPETNSGNEFYGIAGFKLKLF